MTDTTTRHTKRSVQALAAVKWGSKAVLRENRRACTTDERDANMARANAIRARMTELDVVLKPGCPIKALADAARFVVDVDGDDPSIGGLRAPLEAVERWLAAKEERAALVAERDALDCFSYRWSIAVDSGWCWHVHAEADSLDELADKIEGAS